MNVETKRAVLLVEDSETDEKLTLRAFKKSNLANEIVIVRDGAETLEYLFGTRKYEGRDTSALPAVVLLDLNLPRIDGLEVLRRIRADERTRFLPVVILTASKEDEDWLRGLRARRQRIRPEAGRASPSSRRPSGRSASSGS